MFTKMADILTRLLNLDADGDSTMHSSPELEADDEMFPDEGPSTPRNAATFALDPASELSPPDSQGPSALPRGESFAAALNSPSVLNANGKRAYPSTAVTAASATAGAATGTVHTDPASGYQWTKAEDQPGYEWKNTRAREDESKALDIIIDKNSQIKSE